MRKLLVAVLAAGATFAIVAPGAQANSGFCAEPNAPGRVSCTATTIQRGADFYRVRMGRETRGFWALRCTKGNHTETQRGALAKNGVVVGAITLQGNPTCVLRGRGISQKRVFVRVSLR